MKKPQQKQRDDLLFQLIKQSSPYKYNAKFKQAVIQKILNISKLNSKQQLNQKGDRQLISNNAMITQNKKRKKVSFILNNKKSNSKHQQQIKMRLENQQLQRQIIGIKNNVDSMLQRILTKNNQNTFLLKEPVNLQQNPQEQYSQLKANSILKASSFSNTDSILKNKFHQKDSSLKINSLLSNKNQQCQTIQNQVLTSRKNSNFNYSKLIKHSSSLFNLSNQTKHQIKIKYRFETQNKKNQTHNSSQTQFSKLRSASDKCLTKFDQRNVSFGKIKQRPVSLKVFDYQSEEEKSQSTQFTVKDNNFQSHQPSNNFYPSTKNSNIFKKYSQEKCRHQIDIQIFKFKLLNRMQDAKAQNIKKLGN